MKNIKPALILHFFAYLLYLYFFRIVGDKQTILLFKPIILASITFYYVNYSKVKMNILHFVIIGLCFLGDNMNLFGEMFLHEIAIVLYLLILFVLFFLIVKDSKLLNKSVRIEKYFGIIVFVAVLLFLISKFTTTYIIKTKISHYYVILNYIVVFTGVLILSFYNLFKHKTLSSKFLVSTQRSSEGSIKDTISITIVFSLKSSSKNLSSFRVMRR